jgi:predicted AlkP superfamily pyrophosphatase or phosphodiesterase
MLLHFDDPDYAGHSYGFSPTFPAYVNAIETVDSYIQEIMTVIRNREQVYSEEWMIVLTTDHGGEGTGHGGQDDLPQTRKVWSIVRIPSLTSTVLQANANSVDLLPTMLYWMGISPNNFPDLDGVKFF